MVLDVGEDLFVGQEVHFGAALVGGARRAQWRHLDHLAVRRLGLLQQTVLRDAAREIHVVHLAVTAHRQLQPFRQAVHARHAHAVQAARHLVAVLVELAAGVQLGHDDLGGAALRLVLVVELDAGRDAAAVVDHGDRVVGVDGDVDLGAMPRQRFVDGVVQHLEHEVVQAGAIRRIADVHARPLAHRLQAFQDLDRGGAVAAAFGGGGLRFLLFGHVVLLAAMGVGRTWRGCLKTAKGRIFSIQPLVLFSMFLSRLRWASLVKSASA